MRQTGNPGAESRSKCARADGLRARVLTASGLYSSRIYVVFELRFSRKLDEIPSTLAHELSALADTARSGFARSGFARSDPEKRSPVGLHACDIHEIVPPMTDTDNTLHTHNDDDVDTCTHCDDADCAGAQDYACPDNCYRCNELIDNCECNEPLTGEQVSEERMVTSASAGTTRSNTNKSKVAQFLTTHRGITGAALAADAARIARHTGMAEGTARRHARQLVVDGLAQARPAYRRTGEHGAVRKIEAFAII